MPWTPAFAGVRQAVTSPRPARLAFPALIASNVLLALGPWLVRLAEVGPVAAAFWRLALAAPLLVLLARAVGQPVRLLPAAALATVALGAWFFAADLAMWHAGIGLTKLANATLFGNLATFAFAAYGFLVARRWPGAVQWTALVLAAAGAALLMGGSYQLSPRYLRGDLLAAGAGLCYAVYLIAIDRIRGSVGALPLLALSTLLGAPPLLAAAFLFGEPVLPTAWTPLLLLALSSQVLGQGLLVYAIGHQPPLVVALAFMIQPIISGLVGATVYGERLALGDWAGALAILVALVLVRLPDRTPAP